MYELTESQALEVGGGMDGVPYHYKSQRFIPPTWPQDEGELEPPNYQPVNKTMPQF